MKIRAPSGYSRKVVGGVSTRTSGCGGPWGWDFPQRSRVRFFSLVVPRTRRCIVRVVYDDAEDFATATVKTDIPSVVWRDDLSHVFLLEQSVGVGSFGQVWKACDRRTGETVAVKRIPSERGSLSPQRIREKVDQEVAVMLDLQGHPGVVQLRETFIADGHYNIAMGLCKGQDLKSYIKASGTVSEELCAAVAWEILSVLGKCREANVVHGDVKSANFVLDTEIWRSVENSDVALLPNGWLKAVDFGSGRYFRGRPTDVIRGRCGSPVYMAPEVLWGYYGFQADLWSLGITMFYLLTGRFPLWESEEEALLQNLVKIKNTVFKEPMGVSYRVLGNVSSSCIDFISRLLIKDSRRRLTLEEAKHHPFFKENLSLCENGMLLQGTNNIVKSPAFAFMSGKVTPRDK